MPIQYNALYIKASSKVLAVFPAGSVYGSESDRVGVCLRDAPALLGLINKGSARGLPCYCPL